MGILVGTFWLSVLSQKGVFSIFDTMTAFFGPIFGVIISDYYLIKKEKINHKELFYPKETTEYIYNNGWNYKAVYSVIIGFIFAASTIWNSSLVLFQSFAWIIGTIVSFILYYLLNNE